MVGVGIVEVEVGVTGVVGVLGVVRLIGVLYGSIGFLG